MAFCFDDIAVAIGEVAGKVAETAEEVTTIAGDGVEESARNAGKLYSKLVENTEECVTELQKESSPSIPQIEGDGIPEQTSTIEQVPEQRNIEDMQSSDDNNQQSIEREDNTPTSNSENFTDTTDVNSNETEEDSPRTIKTINDSLVGQNHPETGVPYVEKEVVTDTGEKVKGVFPQFDSKIDVQLPEDMKQAPDRTQFAECNKQLAERVAKDLELRSQFTEDQLADIEDGYTPEGYTWHHNEEKGKLQLVDSDIHSQTRHTGGRNIWGGGTENRH